RPIAVAQQRPQAGIAQQTLPHGFTRLGLATDMARDLGIAPQRETVVEIGQCVRSQDQPRRLYDALRTIRINGGPRSSPWRAGRAGSACPAWPGGYRPGGSRLRRG